VNEVPAAFPVVTICNQGYILKKKASSVILNKQNDFDKFRNFYLNDNNNSITPEQKESLSFTMHEMLIACTFAEKKCSASDFKWFSDYKFGNCYMFKSGFTQKFNTYKFGIFIN